MIVKLIDKAKFREMPWANGRGVTTELHVHKCAQSGRMLWRISIAGVDSDGPFSHFQGCDRILALLSGRGINLRLADGTERQLLQALDFAAFPGDVPTYARLVDGPIKDFNIIVDRASFAATLTVISPTTNGVLIDADQLAIFAAGGDLDLVTPGASRHSVPHGDLLLVETPTLGVWTTSAATAIVVQIHPILQVAGSLTASNN